MSGGGELGGNGVGAGVRRTGVTGGTWKLKAWVACTSTTSVAPIEGIGNDGGKVGGGGGGGGATAGAAAACAALPVVHDVEGTNDGACTLMEGDSGAGVAQPDGAAVGGG